MTVLLHMTEASNVDDIRKDGFKAFIGPRSTQISEPSPAVYFFRTLEAAETALSTWFGDSFDDDAQIALIAIDVPVGVDDDPSLYEISIASDVSSSGMRVLSENVDHVSDFSEFQSDIASMGFCFGADQENDEGLSL